MGVAIVAASLVFAGCESDVCEHGTDELSMIAVVTDHGDTVRAKADFGLGERGPLQLAWALCDDDRLRINGVDADVIRRPGHTEYALTLEAEASPRSFEFELEHRDETVRAVVELPDPFEITNPLPEAMHSRAEDLPVAWEPAAPDDAMVLTLEETIGDGICVTTPNEGEDYKSQGGVGVDDLGEWVIPAGAMQGSGDPNECSVLFRLNRFRRAPYPEAFAFGGYAEGRVVRAVGFASIP